jgi:hypothetical protein
VEYRFIKGVGLKAPRPHAMVSAAAVQRAGIQSLAPQPTLKGFQLLPRYTARVQGKTRSRAAADPTQERRVAGYALLYRGIPLSPLSSSIAVSRGDGRIWLTRDRRIPNPETLGDVTPSLAGEQAVAAAKAEFADQFGPGQASEPSLEIWVDPEHTGRLCWTFVVRNKDRDPRAFRYWVDARGARDDQGKPKVWSRKNLIFHLDGKVTGTVWAEGQTSVTHPQGTRGRPLPNLEVTWLGVTRVTTGDGLYSFPGKAGSSPVTARLAGPFCVVVDDTDPDHPFSKNGQGAATINIELDSSSQLQIAQVSAFLWVNAVHDFAAVVLDPLDPSHQLHRLSTNVNIDQRCNALYDHDTTSLNFYRGDDAPNADTGRQCANTAFSDIVYHEYGHAVDDQLGGIHDLGYSEGFGDAMSLLLRRDPVVGHDFWGKGQNLRDASQPANWPPIDPEPHEVGKIYGSFTWTLIQELKKTMSEDSAYAIAKHLILGAATFDPSNIPDAVMLSFLVDDDDDTLKNGAPHFKELAAAADARHIPRPPSPIMKKP